MLQKFVFNKRREIVMLMLIGLVSFSASAKKGLNFYTASHPYFQYTGRIDFSNKYLPRFWQPAVYVSFQFEGKTANVFINDEVLYDTKHNYLELVVDGKAYRLQTKSKKDTITITKYLSAAKVHEVAVWKNTEANIGYIEFAGVECTKLLKPKPKPARRIECYGNSITCGASADMSEIPCGKGKWEDQHNAYLAYGPTMARMLNAQVHLSSVSGIGLMRSCCNMDIIMPQVYDKVSMRNNAIAWDFSLYQPDVVTICLGQNDGIQDSAKFVSNYISFVQKLRGHYPNSTFVLISSPMADDNLRNFLRRSIAAVLHDRKVAGDTNMYSHIFERSYIAGCDFHPSVTEHAVIAKELAAAVQQIMRW
ncbi:MAG TPA: SGNH/GDSL hydrolase family protein [Phnomibacter sp.]|nr:SGNH/GDSL hydrolase family protein [Phnomibacter sp.]